MDYIIVLAAVAVIALIVYGLWDTYNLGFEAGREEGLGTPCRLDQLDPKQCYRVIAICHCKGLLQSQTGVFVFCELVGGAGFFSADQLPEVGWKVRLHREHEFGLLSLKRVEED